jgi:hypothetical protein
MQNVDFRDMTPSTVKQVHWHFGETCRLRLHGFTSQKTTFFTKEFEGHSILAILSMQSACRFCWMVSSQLHQVKSVQNYFYMAINDDTNDKVYCTKYLTASTHACWRPGFDSRQEEEVFLFCLLSKTGPGANAAFYPTGTWSCFTGGKVTGSWILLDIDWVILQLVI